MAHCHGYEKERYGLPVGGGTGRRAHHLVEVLADALP